MKLDQPWVHTLHYQIDNQLLVLCKQEVTTPKRHTDIIREQNVSTCIYIYIAYVSVLRTCVCAKKGSCARVSARVYVSTDVYVRVSDSE